MADASPGDTIGSRSVPTVLTSSDTELQDNPKGRAVASGRSVLRAKNHWGQAVSASSWLLVGESHLLMALGQHVPLPHSCLGCCCPEQKGREEKRRGPQIKTRHRDRRPVPGGPRPRGGRAEDDPRSSPTPGLAFRAFPSQTFHAASQARGRDRQSRRDRPRSMPGAVTESQRPAWCSQGGPRPEDVQR